MTRVIVVLTLFVVAFAACSRDGDPTANEPTSAPTPGLFEEADSSEDVDPNFHVGQQIFITDDGFKPLTLIAVVDEEISFMNETDKPVEIVFATKTFKSGPIEPGEAASFTPENAQSIAYARSDDPDTKGQITVEPYYEPGETAPPAS